MFKKYCLLVLIVDSMSAHGMASPKSLFEYCAVPQLNWQSHKDLKLVIAGNIVGKGGWWYPQTLEHPAYVSSVSVSSEKNMVVTGGEYGDNFLGILRFWREDTKDLVHQCIVPSEQRMSDGVIQAAYSPANDMLVCALERKVLILTEEQVMSNRPLGDSFFKDPLMELPSDHRIRSLFINSLNGQAVVVASDLYGRGKRKDFVRVINTCTGRVIHASQTKFYNLNHAGKAVALHPCGKLFVMAGNTQVNIWNEEWKLVTVLTSESPICACEFNKEGTLLAFACINGHICMYNTTNKELFDEPNHSFMVPPLLGKKDFHDLCDMKFHPTKALLALALRSGSVIFADFKGQLLRQFNKYSIISEIAFNDNGSDFYAVGGSQSVELQTKDNSAVVWKEHTNPTLEQVLMRCILKNHIGRCAALCVDTQTTDLNRETLVPWMADRFNLQEEELKNTWNSMPVPLQESIIKTLVRRGKFSQSMEQKYHA